MKRKKESESDAIEEKKRKIIEAKEEDKETDKGEREEEDEEDASQVTDENPPSPPSDNDVISETIAQLTKLHEEIGVNFSSISSLNLSAFRFSSDCICDGKSLDSSGVCQLIQNHCDNNHNSNWSCSLTSLDLQRHQINTETVKYIASHLTNLVLLRLGLPYCGDAEGYHLTISDAAVQALLQLTSLVHLRIPFKIRSPSSSQQASNPTQLAEALARNTTLRTLEIPDKEICSRSELVNLGHCCSLSSLELRHYEPEIIKNLDDLLLQGHTSLNHLKLVWTSAIHGEHYTNLFGLNSNNTRLIHQQLTSLDLGAGGLLVRGSDLMVLSQSTSLTKLKYCCADDTEDATAGFRVLLQNTRIQSVHPGHLTQRMATTLANMSPPPTHLRSLTLDFGTKDEFQLMTWVIPIIHHCSLLTQLSLLLKVDLTDKLFQEIAKNTALVKLHLQSCKLDSVAPDLSPIALSTTLLHLNLTGIYVNQCIGDLFARNSTLIKLNLDFNRINHDSVGEDLKGLARNTSITSLRLRYLQRSELPSAEVEAFSQNTTLTFLHIHGDKNTQIEPVLRRRVAKNIKRNMDNRKQYLSLLIQLARDQTSKFSRQIPLDIKIHILSFLPFHEMGKSQQQGLQCAKFVLTHQEEVNEMLRAKQGVRLLERCLRLQMPSLYRFRFWPKGTRLDDLGQIKGDDFVGCVKVAGYWS